MLCLARWEYRALKEVRHLALMKRLTWLKGWDIRCLCVLLMCWAGRAWRLPTPTVTVNMSIINRSRQEHPVLIDKYITGREIEVDAVCDWQDILISG